MYLLSVDWLQFNCTLLVSAAEGTSSLKADHSAVGGGVSLSCLGLPPDPWAERWADEGKQRMNKRAGGWAPRTVWHTQTVSALSSVDFTRHLTSHPSFSLAGFRNAAGRKKRFPWIPSNSSDKSVLKKGFLRDSWQITGFTLCLFIVLVFCGFVSLVPYSRTSLSAGGAGLLYCSSFLASANGVQCC